MRARPGRNRRTQAVLAVVFVLGFAGTHAETELTYEAVFDATWSVQSHPVEYPSSAHFSPPIGVVHDEVTVFWRDGLLASPGIEQMAETGWTQLLEGEIEAAAVAGRASASPFFGAFLFSPGGTTSQFTATPTYDHVSWVSMLAPSPDWFVGVDALPLYREGAWIQERVIPLYAHDAGTDDGVTFTSANADSQPRIPIARIVDAPLAPTGDPQPVGTLTLRLLAVADAPPEGDPDGDGLTNLEEANLGTDPLLADTDEDGSIDGADTCPVVADPAQLDVDADGFGDACDVCPAVADRAQRDLDADGAGDACDLDDGALRFVDVSASDLSWQDETVFERFHLYRGDLATLRASAGAATTQLPDGGNADRFCDLTAAQLADAYVPDPGSAVFYLVTGEAAGVESPPGQDGEGVPRGHPAACSS